MSEWFHEPMVQHPRLNDNDSKAAPLLGASSPLPSALSHRAAGALVDGLLTTSHCRARPVQSRHRSWRDIGLVCRRVRDVADSSASRVVVRHYAQGWIPGSVTVAQEILAILCHFVHFIRNAAGTRHCGVHSFRFGILTDFSELMPNLTSAVSAGPHMLPTNLSELILPLPSSSP